MDEYLQFAKALAHEAGDIMFKYFKLGVASHEKADKSIVTQADEEINALVINRVAQYYPSHSVYGEEGSVDKKSPLVWACDPIDGTVPFSKGIPISVFSIALVEDGTSKLGVVFDPFMKRLYSAQIGKGAYLNDQPLRVSTKNLSHQATMDVEWWPEAKYDTDSALHQLSIDTSAYVLHFGSIITGGVYVAAGQLEASVFTGIKGKNVDIAALKVIVEEAGGKVTNLFGEDQRYDQDIKGAIISNGVVHDRIVSTLVKLRK